MTCDSDGEALQWAEREATVWGMVGEGSSLKEGAAYQTKTKSSG